MTQQPLMEWADPESMQFQKRNKKRQSFFERVHNEYAAGNETDCVTEVQVILSDRSLIIISN